jgi:hypothetical protein
MRDRPHPAPQGGLISDTVTPFIVLTRSHPVAGCARWNLERFVAMVYGGAPILVSQAWRLFDSTQIQIPLSLPAPANAAASKVPFSCLSGNPLRLAPQGRPDRLADHRQRRHARAVHRPARH